MTHSIIFADYNNEQHSRDLIKLLDLYARDPMGGGEPLSQHAKQNLISELKANSRAFSILCYKDTTACGFINCFIGFSTFKCAPLVNIHDVYVLETERGQGLSKTMLDKAEEKAKQLGCCKLTLEVLENNHAAKATYRSFGFAGYELDPKAGSAHFWQKYI